MLGVASVLSRARRLLTVHGREPSPRGGAVAEERKAVMKVTSGALENEGEREMRVKYSTWKVALDGPSLLTSARQKHTFPGGTSRDGLADAARSPLQLRSAEGLIYFGFGKLNAPRGDACALCTPPQAMFCSFVEKHRQQKKPWGPGGLAPGLQGTRPPAGQAGQAAEGTAGESRDGGGWW